MRLRSRPWTDVLIGQQVACRPRLAKPPARGRVSVHTVTPPPRAPRTRYASSTERAPAYLHVVYFPAGVSRTAASRGTGACSLLGPGSCRRPAAGWQPSRGPARHRSRVASGTMANREDGTAAWRRKSCSLLRAEGRRFFMGSVRNADTAAGQTSHIRPDHRAERATA